MTHRRGALLMRYAVIIASTITLMIFAAGLLVWMLNGATHGAPILP